MELKSIKWIAFETKEEGFDLVADLEKPICIFTAINRLGLASIKFHETKYATKGYEYEYWLEPLENLEISDEELTKIPVIKEGE